MIVDPVGTYRFEGAVANVQRDLRNLHAAPAKRAEYCIGKVQSRGRCGDGPTVAGVHGLISLAVRRTISTLDVRRQRRVAEALDCRLHIHAAVRPQPNRALPKEATLED